MAINEVIYCKKFEKIKAEMEKQPCIDDLLHIGKAIVNTLERMLGLKLYSGIFSIEISLYNVYIPFYSSS